MSWHGELDTEEFQDENVVEGASEIPVSYGEFPTFEEVLDRIRGAWGKEVTARINRAGGGGCSSGACCGGTCHG